MITEKQESIAKKVLDCAFEVHSHLGPGLLESTYQTCLFYELQQAGLYVEVENYTILINSPIRARNSPPAPGNVSLSSQLIHGVGRPWR
jgi:hypothetical protein